MADKRAYFKLDVGYLSNPKVLSVIDESPTAVLLHIASIAYSAQHLTDGVVPVKALLRMTGATTEDAALLLDAGLWLDLPRGSVQVHDYLKHQRSALEVKGASDAAKRAAQARWDADGNAECNADGMPDALPDASEIAMPREREEKERERDVSEADASDATRDDVNRICEHLADRIEENGSKRPTIGATWRTSARLIIDKDGRTEDQIHRAIDWCQADEFWRGNILSMPKFRDKYDQLRLQAERDRSNVHPLRAATGEGPDDWMRRRPTT